MTTQGINVLGVSESWLSPNNFDSCLSIPGYEVARSDNPGCPHKHGVAAYIRKSCNYNVVECGVGNVLIVFLCNCDAFVFLPSSFV